LVQYQTASCKCKIALNPEKKYKLGVRHLMFSFDTATDIFKIEIIIHVKDIISEGFIASFFINQKMPIYTLRQ